MYLVTPRHPNHDGHISVNVNDGLVYQTFNELREDMERALHGSPLNLLDVYKQKYIIWALTYDEDRHRMAFREVWQINRADDVDAFTSAGGVERTPF